MVLPHVFASWLHGSLCLSETHDGPCMIGASFHISKFSTTLNIILSNQGVHKEQTHTRMGVSITNDWKNMMTNNDALQGQKCTNGVGAVPGGLTAAASDVCSLQMASCTVPAVSSLSTRGTPGERLCRGRGCQYGGRSAFLKAVRLINNCTSGLIRNCLMIIKTERNE